MAAAVADFRPKTTITEKIKKTGRDGLALELTGKASKILQFHEAPIPDGELPWEDRAVAALRGAVSASKIPKGRVRRSAKLGRAGASGGRGASRGATTTSTTPTAATTTADANGARHDPHCGTSASAAPPPAIEPAP